MTEKLRRVPGWLWITGGLTMLLMAGLAFDVSPWLRGDLDWRWEYFPIAVPKRIVLVALLLTLYIVAAARAWQWVQTKRNERYAWWIVGFAAVSGLLLQFAILIIIDPNPWRQFLLRTETPGVGGYFDVATFNTTGIGDLLRRFPALAPGWNVHPQRHPPGLVVYFASLQHLLEQSPALTKPVVQSLHPYRCDYLPLVTVSDAKYAATIGGLLSPFLNAITVIPLYGVGHRLLGKRAALGAALMSPLIPAYSLWTGIWDQAFVIVTVLLLWLLYLALAERRHWAWWVAGGLLSVSSFFTHTSLVMLGFTGAFTLLFLWLERDYWLAHRRQLALNGLGFALMAISVWLAYWVAYDVTFFDVYRANTAPHFDLPSHYFSRLFYNPYDYVLFLGIVLGLLGFVALWQAGKARAESSQLSSAHIMIFAYMITMIVLVVSGISRAEVGRVWMFLMPLALLTAFAVKGGPAHSTGRWAATASLLAAQVIVIQTVLFGNPLVPERTSELANSATPLGTQVGESIELAGYTVDKQAAQPGDTLNVVLYWRSLQRTQESYVAFSHIYQNDLGFAGRSDSPPLGGDYPTTCWQPGEVIEDHISIPIPPDAAPGTYELTTGMYTRPDIQRLPTNGPGASDSAIALTEIQILP